MTRKPTGACTASTYTLPVRLNRLDWLLLATLVVPTWEKIRWETPAVSLTITNLIASAFIAVFVLVLLLISLLADLFRDREEKKKPGEGGLLAPPDKFDPMAGGYPVPPLPGQQVQRVPRRPSRADPQLQALRWGHLA